MENKLIYLDNAAASYPKPDVVYEAVNSYMRHVGAVPDKSQSLLSVKSAELLAEVRKNIAAFFHISDESRVIFTPNSTYAINAVLHGIIRDNDKIVTSLYEHNSVMRPLGRLLITRNIRIDEAMHDTRGLIDPTDLNDKVCGAELVAIAHADNVIGAVQDIETIADIARKNAAYIMVDASQSAGLIDIDVDKMGIDFLCLSGSKYMFAPQGVGVLIVGRDVDHRELITTTQGATGSFSEFEIEPDILPDKFEIGTLNMPAIAGLNTAVKFLDEKGISAISSRVQVMRNRLLDGLQAIKNVKIFASREEITTGIFSFTVNGVPNENVAKLLSEQFSVVTNHGLHCNPRTHKYLGTYPTGSVRMSVAVFNSFSEIDKTIDAVRSISNPRS